MNQNFLQKNQLFFLGVVIALIVCAIDLYSKELIFAILDDVALQQSTAFPEIKVTGFFSLVKVWNTGVSFGMFNSIANGKYILSFINAVVTTILLIWLYRNKSQYITIAIAFIIGGALGNLIDRLQNDAVADFLDFYISSYHWPAFNVADSAVFLGVFLIIFEDLFTKKKGDRKDHKKDNKKDKKYEK
ncbi:MAG: signal peptidase II [Proteobacteria bacterium]|nr:signal peptidase II [Pseudomonadota bacterium]